MDEFTEEERRNLEVTVCEMECQVTSTAIKRETGGLKFLYHVFLVPVPSIVVPASSCFFYCKILCNVVNFCPISPGSRPLGNPASRSLLSRLS